MHDLVVDAQPPILTRGHVWFTYEEKKRSILISVNRHTGETAWQKPFSSYCWLFAAGDHLLACTRSKAFGMVVRAAAEVGGGRRSPKKPGRAAPKFTPKKIKKARACAKPKQSGTYSSLGFGTLVLQPAQHPMTITLKLENGQETVLAGELDGEERYMSAFDVVEAEGAVAFGLSTPDGSRLILLREGSRQTIGIEDLTCVEVLLNAKGTQAACALITADGEVGDATLRVYDLTNGEVAHEKALEPGGLLPMNLRWVNERHVAFCSEEAENNEEWYVWDLLSGGVDAVEKG